MTAPRAHGLAVVVVVVVAVAAACTRASPPEPRATEDRYFLVAASGARAFDQPAAAAEATHATPAATLLPGFGVAIVEERFLNGRRIGRTSHGRWLALADLEPARPAPLAGVVLGAQAALDFAWVVNDGAPVLAAPGGTRIGTRPRWSREHLTGACTDADFCATALGWMRAGDLRVPRAVPRPPEVAPAERWIDVDLDTQTLVAYEGDRPVFATLISAGVGHPGSALATPEGLFRVRSKHLRATMDNLEHTGVVPYSYEDIPLVQYFTERVALHAALWHRQFGHPASHGCVNLAPADAERLFAFTTPRLEKNVLFVAADAIAPGTPVHVHRAAER